MRAVLRCLARSILHFLLVMRTPLDCLSRASILTAAHVHTFAQSASESTYHFSLDVDEVVQEKLLVNEITA